MRFAFFQGCKIPFFLKQYESSSRATLNAFDVELVDIEFGCCGYPTRDINRMAYLAQAARNLALAEKNGLPLMTPCMCCFGSLKIAASMLEEDPQALEVVNRTLAEEGLHYSGKAEVLHILQVFHNLIGLKRIKEKVVNPMSDLKVAVHVGCHALRPSNITKFDDPGRPRLFARLTKATGAQEVRWNKHLQCCGYPLWGKNDTLAAKLGLEKVEKASQAGADCLVAACTYSQMQFDEVQSAMLNKGGRFQPMPSLLYPQLLGLAMGIDAKTLGLDKNYLLPAQVRQYLAA